MDNYERIIKDIWKYERNELKNEIMKNGIPSWLMEKIEKAVDRMNLDEEHIEKIKKSLLEGDEIILSFLMKDPKRQNVYENIFKDELEKNNIVVRKLPSGGPNAYYLMKDEIVSNIQNKPKELKSLDFVILNNNKEIYIVNKYTNEPGGAQDNQYNDVITQLKNLGPKTKDKVWFCLDGKYYTNEKISSLISINKDATIVNIDELIKKIKN